MKDEKQPAGSLLRKLGRFIKQKNAERPICPICGRPKDNGIRVTVGLRGHGTGVEGAVDYPGRPLTEKEAGVCTCDEKKGEAASVQSPRGSLAVGGQAEHIDDGSVSQ